MKFEISIQQHEELTALIKKANEAALSLVLNDPELADELRIKIVIVKELFGVEG